ncbi:MAG: dihydrofolate reductase [Myxococcota bacterium]|nr:dihydrofolate reductase [Myxococcota bacterium]
MDISIIVAAAENDVIGVDGDIPWRLPDDQKRFKALTWGHPIVMGRLTHESIGRLLPGRQTIILSNQANYQVEGALVVSSFDSALEEAGRIDDCALIVGGERVYQLALPYSQRIELTRVHTEIEGDTRFPGPERLKALGFQCIDQSFHPADERHAHPFTFERWIRPLVDSDSVPTP